MLFNLRHLKDTTSGIWKLAPFTFSQVGTQTSQGHFFPLNQQSWKVRLQYKPYLQVLRNQWKLWLEVLQEPQRNKNNILSPWNIKNLFWVKLQFEVKVQIWFLCYCKTHLLKYILKWCLDTKVKVSDFHNESFLRRPHCTNYQSLSVVVNSMLGECWLKQKVRANISAPETLVDSSVIKM